MTGLKKFECETRLCMVKNEIGYFHTWEHYSKPVEASLLIGGAPAGIFSRVYGIVEFTNGVRRIDPDDICFCDDHYSQLCLMQRMMNSKEKESG